MAGVVLAEPREAPHREAGGAVVASAAGAESHRVDLRLAVVAEQVAAVERREGGVADDVAADDRAVAVAVLGDERGPDRAGGGARLEAVIALEDAPPVVGSGAVARTGEVDLLLGVLADIADDQVPRAPVKGEAPRVAQPVGPDLGPPPRLMRERVAGGDGVDAV